MTVKERVIKAIQELPQDASIEDAMEKLYLLIPLSMRKYLQTEHLGQQIFLRSFRFQAGWFLK